VRLLILPGKTCGNISNLTLADHLRIFLSRKNVSFQRSTYKHSFGDHACILTFDDQVCVVRLRFCFLWWTLYLPFWVWRYNIYLGDKASHFLLIRRSSMHCRACFILGTLDLLFFFVRTHLVLHLERDTACIVGSRDAYALYVIIWLFYHSRYRCIWIMYY